LARADPTAEHTMKIALILAAMLVSSGWQLRPPTAQPQSPDTQQIRIEPVDGNKVRLRISGREDWIVEALTFNVIPGNGITRVRADRATVRTAGRTAVADAFEMTISPSGSLGFDIANAKRR
jgi:hypothetical protein